MRNIVDNPVRRSLDDIFSEPSDNNAFRERIMALGLPLVEKSDFDISKKCHWYVFRGQKWYESLEANFEVGRLSVFEWFREYLKNYTEVDEPQGGDVVVYLYTGSYGTKMVGHVGKFSRGKVKSKFGPAEVYEHGADEIPSRYGDRITYFRPNLRQRLFSKFF